jgi:hypothetical protein
MQKINRKSSMPSLNRLSSHLRNANGQRYSCVCMALLLLGAASIAGCTGQANVDGSWQNDKAQKQTFSRVLIVGVSPDAGVRCDFEQFLATQVRSESTTAIVSCNVMSIKEPLSLESIERVIAEQHVDSVLATTLVAAEVGAAEGGQNDTRGDGYYKATGTGYATPYYGRYYGGFGAYGVPVIYGEFRTAPPITTVDGEVEIVTRLWATSDASMVYEMNTTAKNLQSRDSALAAITPPIADRLRRKGFIR